MFPFSCSLLVSPPCRSPPSSHLFRDLGSPPVSRRSYRSPLVGYSRARAHVRIAEPSSVLLGLVTRLLVTVSATPTTAADTGATVRGKAGDSAAKSRKSGASGGDAWRCGKPPHPFRGGFLHLECEPAPVPPPMVAPHFAAATSSSGGEASPPEGQSTSPPVPPPLEPARPRAERAFFWSPAGAAGVKASGGQSSSAAAAAAAVEVDGRGDFLPVVVGGDGQPTEGIPLPCPSVESSDGSGSAEDDQVTVPVWVRSETAGKVAVRARVVYGLGGKSTGVGRGAAAEEGVAVTEWARAEVLCVRPLATTVDVVSLQATEDRGFGGAADGSVASKRTGHTVAVKVGSFGRE